MIALTESQRALVQNIVRIHVPDRRVGFFGSRARGTKKPFADLDLVIFGKTPLPLQATAKLRDAFSESSLPFRVDIVDAASTSADFLEEIKKDTVWL